MSIITLFIFIIKLSVGTSLSEDSYDFWSG